MKKIASLLLIATILLSCFALSACAGNSSVVIIATNDGSAEVLKSKIEAKTGEKIDIVSQDKAGNSTVIVISKNSEGFDTYGWSASDKKITLAHNVLTDFNTVADAFVSNISDLESINSVQTASFTTSAEDSIFDANDSMFAVIDAKSDELKSSVLNAPAFDITTVSGTVYYVSNNGDDSNDGKSANSAWATLSKASNADLAAGDAVLFECGSVFRGTISAKAGVTYASYGTGDMPIIMQSKKNYAQDGLWELVDSANNIWKLKEYVSDPGIIVFNANVDAVDCVGEITATRVWNKDDDSSTRCPYKDLTTTTQDLVYYWGTPTSTYKAFNQYGSENVLYLRSEKNPNTDYSNIEIGEDIHLFDVGGNDITVDGCQHISALD